MTHKSSDDFHKAEPAVGSTHGQFGAGRPRLIFKVGSGDGHDFQPREFDLLDATTKIGSGPDMDLKLEGLAVFHAEVRHDEQDEYVLYIHDSVDSKIEPVPLTGDSPEAGRRVLRTGSPVGLGDWAMSYYREEFADHGRPFGGREGGEGAIQADQQGQPTRE